MSFDAVIFLKSLTSRPGVYQMLGADGAVLYVGKAKNLRKRVSSYFRKSGLAPKTEALVKRIVNVEVTVTETELEALLLEQNLIKEYKPPFNILLRDDKSYPYIFLSSNDEFPRLSFHRGAKRRKGTYFGPFPGVQAVRESMSFLQKTFRVRQCQDSFFKNRSRPCLQYQIKRCNAPCVGLINKDEYQRDVRHTQMFLSGENPSLMKELELAMDRASDELDFEDAATYRDQIAAMRQVQAQQVIEAGNGNIDVLGFAMEGSDACIHVLYIRHGRMLGSRSFYPRSPLALTGGELLGEFIPQNYLKTNLASEIPKEIAIGSSLEEKALLEQALQTAAGRKVAINDVSRGTRRKWIELATRTAEQNLTSKLAAASNIYQRYVKLQSTLGLDALPERLECFDISHSSGEATVASCVVFNQEGPLKSDYRRFNIENITPGDDYAAMEQALRRRYKRLQDGEGSLPDILFIDGGKGQLRIAEDVLGELGVVGVTLVGIAKGSSRKPGLETLFLTTDSGEREILPDPSGLLLIQQIRDEAHRFAITGHRQRRDKKRHTSRLEGIAGVGPKRRRELLRFFGGVAAVEKASVADLMRVPSINRKVAETIYSTLHNG
ncbi:MAG: excinuclease ABC subunit UvrC [Gammaproteobacteria bacterium]|nr:excinuclease ABC subunit UvrC [Gammaproteobacteria bacterium]MBQ0840149.1 excinuclease ABC subunit UvrC [Gammaproteobacteria bacterium]